MRSQPKRAWQTAVPAMGLLLLVLTSCNSGPAREPSLGDAYAGPASLPIRQDIALRSPEVATVKHGDRLEILQQRRRSVKVRTERGAEGWTDDRLLLTPGQVANLRQLSEHSKSAPSQGAATTYDTLNVHIEPERQSPSFLQVNEGEIVDVVGRRVAPRYAPPRPAPRPPAPKAPPKRKKKAKALPPLPMPPPPKLPPDWQEFAKTVKEPVPIEAPQPVPMEDWSLIRNAAGKAGWVLTRRLVMAIPDEVAQYAEGRRIVSYFKLGETLDRGEVKPSWLWTTVERGLEPHDFDSFRVFVWSLRKHRYETAYIDRNLKGFFPVLTHPAPAPGFSILVEKKDGQRYRRRYTFSGNAVRFSGEERVEIKPVEQSNPSLPATQPEPAPDGGRWKRRFDDWRRRLFPS